MISEARVRELSRRLDEPAWLLESRLRGLAAFRRLPFPKGVPASLIRGLEAEEPIKRRTHDLGEAVRARPELVRRHLGSVVDFGRDKFAALNAALWSGGTFVHVPQGVALELPVEASVSLARGGRFERTLIVAEEGAQVEYIEGCAAPAAASGLRASVFEVVAEKAARVRCVTIQDWPDGVTNIAAKAAVAREGASVEWLDGSLGSRLTIKRPRITLAGRGASGRVFCCAFADKGRRLEIGGEIVGGSGTVLCLGATRGTGRVVIRSRGTERRGELLRLGSRDMVRTMSYLASRGLDPAQAESLAVEGFLERFTRELPLEYSVEFSRLLQLALQP